MKPTHVNKNDAIVTDQKLRHNDDGIYAQEKQEFQGSEKKKQREAESVAEESSIEEAPSADNSKRDEK
ncbi:MAG: hypothetical protein WKF55_01890 [Gemmatimonadaceae bacterium]